MCHRNGGASALLNRSGKLSQLIGNAHMLNLGWCSQAVSSTTSKA
jgi:hypothetical protein